MAQEEKVARFRRMIRSSRDRSARPRNGAAVTSSYNFPRVPLDSAGITRRTMLLFCSFSENRQSGFFQ